MRAQVVLFALYVVGILGGLAWFLYAGASRL
jgi:hypothetical protein